MGRRELAGGRLTLDALRLIVAVLVVASFAAAWQIGPDGAEPRRAPARSRALNAATVAPPVAAIAPASPQPAPPPTPTTAFNPLAPAVAAAASADASSRPVVLGASPALLPTRPPEGAEGIHPYTGLGTWIDVYDWSQTYTRDGTPAVGEADIDRMAAAGVETIYVQASKHDAPGDVLEPERLLPLIDRAHAHGIDVVAWYLPTLVDPARDLQRLLAISQLQVEGVAVDIEARNVDDVAERNRRLVALSHDLRHALPDRALGAIVLPPVVLEEVNRAYWPDFPWAEIAPLYDVWQTMGYWTNRKSSSGWRDAHDYTVENVVRLRRNIGLPDAVVHPIGGIGDATTRADIDGFHRAAVETHSVGGSLYDWRTTRADAWPALQAFRRR